MTRRPSRPSELAALFAGTMYATDAGSTISSAYDLGQLGDTRSLAGSVGGFDPSDVMRFTLDTQSTVTLGLSGLYADIDLYLYNAKANAWPLQTARARPPKASRARSTQALTTFWLRPGGRRSAPTRSRSARLPLLRYRPPRHPATDHRQPIPRPQPTPTPADPVAPVTALPDVAYYGGSNDWNLNAINAPESWAAGYTGQGVIVAVVDTGVDINHPDLMSQIWVNAGEIAGNGIDDDGNGYVDDVHGWDFASNDNNPDDGNGHGTHVAGTIAADDNGIGATGVAPDATIMPVRVLGNNGSGSASSVAAGIRYAVNMGADIINLSLGGSYSSLILSAIEYAVCAQRAGRGGGRQRLGRHARLSGPLQRVADERDFGGCLHLVRYASPASATTSATAARCRSTLPA